MTFFALVIFVSGHQTHSSPYVAVRMREARHDGEPLELRRDERIPRRPNGAPPGMHTITQDSSACFFTPYVALEPGAKECLMISFIFVFV